MCFTCFYGVFTCCLRILAVECKIQTAEFISLEETGSVPSAGGNYILFKPQILQMLLTFKKNILGHLSWSSSMYFYHNHSYEKNVSFSIDCIAENVCFWIDLNILNTAWHVKTLNPNSEAEEALILWKVATFLLQKGRKEMRRK